MREAEGGRLKAEGTPTPPKVNKEGDFWNNKNLRKIFDE
jgi:hypothetical protein